MLLRAEESFVLVVDCQEKLMPAIHEVDDMLAQIGWLLDVAAELDVPALASEQYPNGLGHTVAPVAERLAADAVMEKNCFSCAEEEGCRQRFRELNRRQAVVVGAEAHVCVLQSALGLLAEGWQVFVVEEGVSSRQPRDKALALERMRQCGVQVVSREMVAFEWLHRAGTDVFRDVAKRFIR